MKATVAILTLKGSARPELVEQGKADVRDDFLWLEELRGDCAQQWLRQQNQRTVARYAQTEDFRQLEQRLLGVLQTDTRLAMISKAGRHYYNFWQDKDNPRGLLRRASLQEYRKARPGWETVLDIDALARAEGRDWVFKGMESLPPDHHRCLLMLSPDGGDAQEIREFDLLGKCFVEDGFRVAAAKSSISWIDKDTVFIATDWGADSLTRSSYPRIAKRWRRGTPLGDAQTVYEAQPQDLQVFAYRDHTPGFERDYLGRMLDFHRRESFLLDAQNRKIRLDIPEDAEFVNHREWLLLELSRDWEVGGRSYPSGSLLAADFNAYLAGKRDFQVLFTPTPHTALSSFSKTRDHLILTIMDNVVSRIEVLTPQGDGWQQRPLGAPQAISTMTAVGVDPQSNDYFLTMEGFLQPTSLYMGHVGSGEAGLLKQEAPAFDAGKYQVSQHFVRSRDGTRIPYFQVSARCLKPDGSHPTQLYGYGGFEVSLPPRYAPILAEAWLERGGVFVQANIRGGGEFGPGWHQAALKENRHRAHEDFAAVAQDLIDRKVTAPPHLGARGGSNGGLLVGNMLTLYAQLFGCIVCEVPLLDMQRYSRLSAGASWVAEYGDPDKPDEWAYLKTFSPYHNVKARQAYPPVLFCTSTSDDRVNPAHARKMSARMQQMGYEQVYFYENPEGGHNAASDLPQEAFHSALASEFMWSHLSRPAAAP